MQSKRNNNAQKTSMGIVEKDAIVEILPLLLVVFVSIIPNFGFNGPEIVGVEFRPYRIVIPLVLIFLLVTRRFSLENVKRPPYVYWAVFIVFWILYGIIGLIVCPYVEPRRGVLELVAIAFGLITIAIFAQYQLKRDSVRIIFTLMKALLVLLIVVAIVEIITGWHFPTAFYSGLKEETASKLTHTAAAFMYNVNDFSSLLTCLLPACFYKPKLKALIAIALGILFIDVMNDATINIVAAVVELVIFVIFIGRVKHWTLSKRAKIILTVLLVIVVGFVVYKFVIQLINLEAGGGSMRDRLVLYRDSFNVAAATNFLGMGPGSFSDYFTAHPSSSNLVNPHCYVLEILSQYGIIVLVIYLVLYVRMFYIACRTMARGFRRNKRRVNDILAIEFLVGFFISSFAASSTLDCTYQWLLLALACMLLPNAELLPLPTKWFNLSRSRVTDEGNNKDAASRQPRRR